MKKIIRLMVVLIFPFYSFAQSVGDSINYQPLLFESFSDGAVLMKSGEIEKSVLNYNTDDQTIVFVKNRKYMVLTGLEEIDTIYILQRKFVPVNNTVYEVIASTLTEGIFIGYTNKIRPVTPVADHGGVTMQSTNQVSNTVSDIYINRVYKKNYSIEIFKHFRLGKNNRLYKIDNEKQFVKLFSSKAKPVITAYINQNAINFKSETDLIKLFNYCTGQVSK